MRRGVVSVLGCGKSSLRRDVERGVKSVLGCGGSERRSGEV